jgi:hypothetical protein
MPNGNDLEIRFPDAELETPTPKPETFFHRPALDP